MRSQIRTAGHRILINLVSIAALCAATVTATQADTTTTSGERSGEGSTSFTGLAQSPEANLFTGSLTTSVPIKVPPGRKGMTPKLSLQYSSSAGASTFGHGWSFPVGRISRSTKFGAPRCTGDHTDDFVIALPDGGSLELIQTTPGHYRPLVESKYLSAKLDQTTNSWIVRDLAGVRYVFGDHSSARVASVVDGPILQQNPDGSCDLTASWMLTHMEDTNGNTIEIEWINAGNVSVPSRVLYGGNENGINHFYRVELNYAFRPVDDLFVTHRLGLKQQHFARLQTIQVITDVPDKDEVIRTYGLHYLDDGDQRSLLSSITATAEPTQTFAYASLGDGHANPAQGVAISVPSGFSYLRQWTSSLEVVRSIIDMNGDGKLDLIVGGGFPWTVHFGVNDGTDSFSFDANPVAWTGSNLPPGHGQIRNVWVTTGPCDENGWACTVVDTFDITGDGRVDYVLADQENQPWRVYQGELKANGVWGFADQPILWPAPDRFLRRAKDGHTYRDTIDVNGDGLPDLIDVSNGQWSVWLSTGVGFEADPLPVFHSPVDSLTYTNSGNSGATSHMLTDFDGDGLVDLARHFDAQDDPLCDDFEWNAGIGQYINRHDCLALYRNTGQGFSETPVVMALPLWVDGLTVQSNNTVIADLVDINGDGLPDWVGESDTGEWTILVNLSGQLATVDYDTSPPYDAVATATWPGGQGPLRQNIGRQTKIDLVDINGDGFLDRVTGGSTVWNVQLNSLTQPPNALTMMENGLGGTNTIVYEPSSRYDHNGGDGEPDLPFHTWVVGGTRLNDGLCTPPSGSNVFNRSENPCIDSGHELISFFDYQDGRLQVDYDIDSSGNLTGILDRGFYGFRRVTRIDIDGNETASVFGQGSLVRGQLLQLYYYAGDTETGTLVRFEANQWMSRAASHGRDQTWLHKNTVVTFDDGATPHAIVTENLDVDAWGNVRHTTVAGNHMSMTETLATYATPFGSNDCFPYDKPSTVVTKVGGQILESRRFTYDNSIQGTLTSGNLTKVETWLDTESAWIAIESDYDAYGNIVRSRDGNGSETTFDYTDPWDTTLYPIVKTNPLGHQSASLMDYRHGKPAITWGANGPATATRYEYDAAGRLTCEVHPGDSTTSCTIATTHTFATTPGEHSTVRVEQKQSGYATGRVTTAYIDALGRERYSETRSVVRGDITTVRRNQVEFDAAGRVHKRYYAYPASDGVPSNGATTFDYHLNGGASNDPLGRVYETFHPDGTSTRVEYRGERIVSFDEEGYRTERRIDAKERVVREETFDANSLYSSKQMDYDGMGRLTAIYENDHTQPTKAFIYDTMGRRIITVDRDSGTWVTGYDHADNLIYRDDPKPNQHIQYCYDEANRPLRTCALPEDFRTVYSCHQSCTASDSRYTYDDPSIPFSIGRLTEVSDEAGSFRVLEYDARGRQIATERTIAANNETTAARFEYEYNNSNEVVLVRYPDGEEVSTTFDEAGQPISMQNSTGKVYIESAHYDVFGRADRVWHGNGVRDDRTYEPAEKRHRLAALVSQLPHTQSTLLLYQYTPRGQISFIGDNTTDVTTNTAQYSYDHLGRLTEFNSHYDPADRQYTYDAWGNITQKGGLALSYGDPYAPSQSPHHIAAVDGTPMAYDANGNRTTNAESNQVYLHDAHDRLKTIFLPGSNVEFLYDHEGMRRARVVTSGNDIGVTRYYSDLIHTQADGRVIKSYFFGGMRVATRSTHDNSWQIASAGGGPINLAGVWQGRPVLFLEVNPMMQSIALLATGLLLLVLVVAPRERRKRVVGLRVQRVHAALVALIFTLTVMPWPIIVRPANAQCGGPTPTPGATEELSHLHSDHLGSVQTITDADGHVVEKIRYFPYGEVRGRWDGAGNPISSPAADDVRFGFGGLEGEGHSGLVYAGARFYDPVLGSFLSIDPAGEFTNPYTYVGWDPVNGSDPTGECELICLAIVAFVVGFAIGAIDAAISGASLSDSLKAGLISGVTSAAGSILGPAGTAVGGLEGWAQGIATAFKAVSKAYGVYTTIEAFRDGEYLAGSRGALQIVSAAFGGLESSNAGIGAKPSEMPLNFTAVKNMTPASPAGGRISTLISAFPEQPISGTTANVSVSSITIFGIKIEVGTAWAIDSSGNKQIFDIFSLGFETEVFEIGGVGGVNITDAASVTDLGGNSTTIGGSGGPSPVGFGGEYNVGGTYSGVTVYGSAQYGIAPVGVYGLRETWTPHGE